MRAQVRLELQVTQVQEARQVSQEPQVHRVFPFRFSISHCIVEWVASISACLSDKSSRSLVYFNVFPTERCKNAQIPLF